MTAPPLLEDDEGELSWKVWVLDWRGRSLRPLANQPPGTLHGGVASPPPDVFVAPTSTTGDARGGVQLDISVSFDGGRTWQTNAGPRPQRHGSLGSATAGPGGRVAVTFSCSSAPTTERAGGRACSPARPEAAPWPSPRTVSAGVRSRLVRRCTTFRADPGRSARRVRTGHVLTTAMRRKSHVLRVDTPAVSAPTIRHTGATSGSRERIALSPCVGSRSWVCGSPAPLGAMPERGEG